MDQALSEIKVGKFIEQEECIFTVLAVISRQNKVRKVCKSYLNLIAETGIENMQVAPHPYHP